MTWIFLGGMGVLALVLFLYASFGLMFVFGAPWVPTSKKVARAMLKLAKVKKGDRVLDLGCGNGVISILAAKEFGAKSTGLDIHPGLIWWARWRAWIGGVKTRTQFKRANLLKITLPKADIVTVYLLEGLMGSVRPILVRDLDPKTCIVSHGFEFDGVQARQELSKQGKTVYLYKVKDLKK